MHKTNTISLEPSGQELSVEDQYFTLVPLARLMIEEGIKQGIMAYPDFGLLEFDATALLTAHAVGRVTLPRKLLRAVISISRGQGYRPNRAERREIEARMHKLISWAGAVLRAIQPHPPGAEGLQ